VRCQANGWRLSGADLARGPCPLRRPLEPLVGPAAASNLLLSGDPVIVRVCSNPDPEDAAGYVGAECAVVLADSDGPELAETFEVQGRVTWVRFEQGEASLREFPCFDG